MKNSEIYKIAILAVISCQKVPETMVSAYALCEVLYKLTQDWYWSREAEKDDEAKAQEALRRLSEENGEADHD